jgi:hypothetical protein
MRRLRGEPPKAGCDPVKPPANGQPGPSFAPLIHGIQPKASEAGRAVPALRGYVDSRVRHPALCA